MPICAVSLSYPAPAGRRVYVPLRIYGVDLPATPGGRMRGNKYATSNGDRSDRGDTDGNPRSLGV
ncbi:hypothetical protein GOPIP_104_00170 [Gordonia polyisoprenivorans NBRC 16320 = JCM 10675]|nr:hypothetical protein GOPIP_104_00170 [Gordonia polyisoprenivorans NBRC 16320 = JCM 10675]